MLDAAAAAAAVINSDRRSPPSRLSDPYFHPICGRPAVVGTN
jgi:hypothetical protein